MDIEHELNVLESQGLIKNDFDKKNMREVVIGIHENRLMMADMRRNMTAERSNTTIGFLKVYDFATVRRDEKLDEMLRLGATETMMRLESSRRSKNICKLIEAYLELIK